MGNTIEGISFALSSLEDFEDREFAGRIIDIVMSAPVSIRPTFFGEFEPVDAISDIENVLDVFVNARPGNTKSRAGSLMLQVSADFMYQIQWNKKREPSFQLIGGFLMNSAVVRRPQILNELVLLLKALAIAANVSYGDVRSMAFKGWDTPFDLKTRLPDFPNACIYGSDYVDLFGEDRIRAAPFHRVEQIAPKAYWTEVTEGLLCPVNEAQKRLIREHLGEDAFMSEGRWRYKDGVAPRFDFSKVVASE